LDIGAQYAYLHNDHIIPVHHDTTADSRRVTTVIAKIAIAIRK
jgi:hypothetical protein